MNVVPVAQHIQSSQPYSTPASYRLRDVEKANDHRAEKKKKKNGLFGSSITPSPSPLFSRILRKNQTYRKMTDFFRSVAKKMTSSFPRLARVVKLSTFPYVIALHHRLHATQVLFLVDNLIHLTIRVCFDGM